MSTIVLESDRLHDLALERAVVGALILHPDLLGDADVDDFDSEESRRILRAARTIPPDRLAPTTIVESLSAAGDLDVVGGEAAVVGVFVAAHESKPDIAVALTRLHDLRLAREALKELRATEPAWSELEQGARPTIMVRNDLSEMAAEAESALLADPDTNIYVRSRRLVRVVRDEGVPHGGLRRSAGSPVIEQLPLDALRNRLDQAAVWKRLDSRSKTAGPVLPPEWVARAVAASDAWGFPTLVAVVEAPTLKLGGELLTRPGYDQSSGLLLMPSGDFPPIPSRPSAAEVRAAVDLLREPFADFPFVGPCDLAAAVAAVLSLVARHAMEGCVPMFPWRATAPGSGKGLGCDVVSRIGTGRSAARMSLPDDDDEIRKLVLALAFEGTPAVCLDNIDRPLGSQSLAAALTAEDWQGRLLGSTALLRAPLRAVWLATGNGLTFRGDLGRRVVPVDLDAHVEHPEDRRDFRHPDLLDWVRDHRGALVVAALTVLRGYHVAGRPAHGCGPRKGSFEAWDDLVRGSCVWVGVGDPLEGCERVRREDDGDLMALRAALAAWHEAFGNSCRTAAEAVAEALRCAERGDIGPRDALLGLMPHREKLDGRPLGYALRQVRGRISGGLSFETAGEQHGTTRWRVTAIGKPKGEMTDMGDMFPPIAGVDGRQGVTSRAAVAGTISPMSAISPASQESGHVA